MDSAKPRKQRKGRFNADTHTRQKLVHSHIAKELMGFIREKEEEYEYKEIGTPVVANTALWHVSGHMDHYRENMFYFDSGMGELGLKPMNCPSSILVYKSRLPSMALWTITGTCSLPSSPVYERPKRRGI